MTGPRDETPADPDADGSYYVLATVNRWSYYLDMQEGDRLATKLDELLEGVMAPGRADGDAMFVMFTDRSGSEVRVRTAHIECMYVSTPATRAKDKAFNEAAKRDKDWSQDDS